MSLGEDWIYSIKRSISQHRDTTPPSHTHTFEINGLLLIFNGEHSKKSHNRSSSWKPGQPQKLSMKCLNTCFGLSLTELTAWGIITNSQFFKEPRSHKAYREIISLCVPLLNACRTKESHVKCFYFFPLLYLGLTAYKHFNLFLRIMVFSVHLFLSCPLRAM